MEETKFIDAESYTGGDKEKLTFREIMLSHLKKISTYASVEFRGGFWEDTVKVIGNMSVTNTHYVADSREIYSNSIEYFYDLLFPHFDKEMKEAGEKAEKEIKETFKDHTVIKEPEREDENKDTIIKEEESKVYRNFKDTSNKISFRSRKRKINRILFRELCSFLKRVDYFKGKTFEEEA